MNARVGLMRQKCVLCGAETHSACGHILIAILWAVICRPGPACVEQSLASNRAGRARWPAVISA